jgi:hypothetical protein
VRGFVTKTLDGRFNVHVMEYVEGGDLLAHVTSSKEGCIDEGRLRPIVWDMATAVRDAKRLGAVMIMVRILAWFACVDMLSRAPASLLVTCHVTRT